MATAVNTPPWLIEGRKHIGLKEIKGSKNNPTIVQWGKSAGIDWWNNDDDAWCAVFVGGILAAVGLPTTKSALARSYMDYGIKLDPKRPVVGAIVVFPRGTNPTFGHVGFVDAVNADGKTIRVLNGNMSDEVRYSTFTIASIIGLSWPAGVPLPAGAVRIGQAVHDEGVLRRGSGGSVVMDLQKSLNVLGYKLTENGSFDGATEDAVKRFQARRDIEADGVAGTATRAALKAAVDAKRAAAKPMPPGGGLKSGAVQGGLAAAGVSAGGVVLAAKDVKDVVDDAKSANDGTYVGLAFFLVFLIGGLFIVWNRYREAGTLPTWLGGRAPADNVPEA